MLVTRTEISAGAPSFTVLLEMMGRCMEHLLAMISDDMDNNQLLQGLESSPVPFHWPGRDPSWLTLIFVGPTEEKTLNQPASDQHFPHFI